ncbi:glycine-rich protein-like [Lingula anatina]|uniref:Glycine-rich protein-like n=1 Tax=Lingula anatina TaxID=7574 RepID=A0A1S3JSH0_LINAN|nr:glycine-rich protein-like [Lingula anatina]|eukprot:XP_013412964.1 glycine-rich protein-like [Lingula anatina]
MMLKAVVVLAIVAFAAAVPGTKYYPAPDGSGRLLYFPRGYVSGDYRGGIPVNNLGYGGYRGGYGGYSGYGGYGVGSYAGYGYGKGVYGLGYGRGLYGLGYLNRGYGLKG